MLDARVRAALAGVRSEGRSIDALRDRGMSLDRAGSLEVFIRGTVSREALEAAGARVRTALPGLYTASLPAPVVERVAALPGVVAIRSGVRCDAELEVSVPTTGVHLLRGPGPAFAGLNGEGVVVGVVDSGVDYQHGDFRDSTGATRILSLWDQTATGTGPSGYPYGREWSRADLDLGTCQAVDTLEHGTHVAGIAAGDGSQTGGSLPAFTYGGMAPRADLVVVKTDFLTPEIIDAVGYIFQQADSRGASAVVNLSLGTHYGSHDGLSEFEQALNALAGPGRIIVKSGGNDRGKPCHAQVFATAAGAAATLSVSGSGLSRYFGIDGYYDATERLRVRVRTPNGTIIGPLDLNAENAPWPGQVTQNGTVYLAHDSLSSGLRAIYLEVGVEQAGRNMNGTWTITLLADHLGSTNGEVDLWRFLAHPGVTADFVVGNLPTQELISEPGNAPDVVTVGAWVSKTSWTSCNDVVGSYPGGLVVGGLAPFSSPGPTRDGRTKPDLVAPGIAIGSSTSFDVAHSCPPAPTVSELLNDGTNHRVLSGTSLSAPHVAGAVALLLQKFGPMTPAQVMDYLRAHATADAFTGPLPSSDWGHGKLALGDLVDPLVRVVYPNGDEVFAPGDLVTLAWTATDAWGAVDVVDLQLSRTGPEGPFENIAQGVPNSGTFDWQVTGPSPAPRQAYLRVLAHDSNANVGMDVCDDGFTITGPAGAAWDAPLRAGLDLSSAEPNPTTGVAQARFTVPRSLRVSLTLHDVQGRFVAQVAQGEYPAGSHRAVWDGKRNGSPAPAGLYFLCLETPAGRVVRRVVVSR